MDKSEIRRARLRQVIDDRFQGVVARLAAFLDMKPPQLHRWLSGKQGIHEDSAAAMCQKLGLPTGWLDLDVGLLPSPNTQAGQPPIQSPAENVVTPAFIEPRRWPFSPEIHDRILRLSGAEIAELESVLALQLELVEARLSRAGAETMPSKRAS